MKNRVVHSRPGRLSDVTTCGVADVIWSHHVLQVLFPFAGDLSPRHMQVFRANEFFRGVTLPQPDSIEPLENRLPKQCGAAAIDFLKVNGLVRYNYMDMTEEALFIKKHCERGVSLLDGSVSDHCSGAWTRSRTGGGRASACSDTYTSTTSGAPCQPRSCGSSRSCECYETGAG